jgi:hypothetical protein
MPLCQQSTLRFVRRVAGNYSCACPAFQKTPPQFTIRECQASNGKGGSGRRHNIVFRDVCQEICAGAERLTHQVRRVSSRAEQSSNHAKTSLSAASSSRRMSSVLSKAEKSASSSPGPLRFLAMLFPHVVKTIGLRARIRDFGLTRSTTGIY